MQVITTKETATGFAVKLVNDAQEGEHSANEYMRKLRTQAMQWLNMRYLNVLDEELTDKTAADIDTILRWQDDCMQCTDVRQCRHSRAVLEICEETNARGEREFVTRARLCASSAEHEQTEERHANYRDSGIPEARYNNTFDKFQTAGEFKTQLLTAKGIAKECAESHTGLILGGTVGSGKTHLAIAMGLYALNEGRTVKFFSLSDLLERLRSERWEHRNELLEQVKACDLLILDDAGAESGAVGWKDELFFVVINHRYDNWRQTVITTNAVGREGLESVLKGGNGERIFSRLMGMTAQVWLNGVPDYRRGRR